MSQPDDVELERMDLAIPPFLLRILQLLADANGRSLNGEIIVRLIRSVAVHQEDSKAA